MSASSHSFPKVQRGPDVLGELLHSLSQPLTSLRCSLELSIEEAAEQQQERVSAALQQTEKVIGMIQLMREYLDAGQLSPEGGPEAGPVALAPALRSVVVELSSIAAVRGVRLCLAGTCTAALPLPESRLRLALQYLITALIEATIEARPAGGKVMLLLSEGPAGAVLRAYSERGLRGPNGREQNLRGQEQSDTGPPEKRGPAGTVSTLRRVRLEIASRVLESTGASLISGDLAQTGFVLRIPRRG